jgi:hypothetical protein
MYFLIIGISYIYQVKLLKLSYNVNYQLKKTMILFSDNNFIGESDAVNKPLQPGDAVQSIQKIRFTHPRHEHPLF